MRRLALPLALLAPLAAFAQTETEPIEPVLVTFREEAATLTERWWKGGGSYKWNGVTAAGSTGLLDASGQASGLSLTCVGTICGKDGRLAEGQYDNRKEDFPKGVTTGDNGWVLNGAGAAPSRSRGWTRRARTRSTSLPGAGTSGKTPSRPMPSRARRSNTPRTRTARPT